VTHSANFVLFLSGDPPVQTAQGSQPIAAPPAAAMMEPEPEVARRAEEGVPPARAAVSVSEWLASIKLEAYADAIAEEGYDELQFLGDAEEADIDELLETLQGSAGAGAGVGMKKPHARTLKKAWKALRSDGA